MIAPGLTLARLISSAPISGARFSGLARPQLGHDVHGAQPRAVLEVHPEPGRGGLLLLTPQEDVRADAGRLTRHRRPVGQR